MMFRTVVIVVLLTCLLTITSASHVLSVTKFQTSTCSDRQAPVIICPNCNTVAACVQVGGSWNTVLLEACNTAGGFFCNEFEGRCSNSVGSCNPVGQDGSFICNTPGVFPDPVNCRVYHMCFVNGNTPVAISMDCGGAAFSPATGDCSLPLNDTICSTPQYTCDFVGQMNSWPGNNNIYYICASETVDGNRVFKPLLFRCPPNEMFQDGRCVQRDWSDLPPGSIIPYICERVGLFPDRTHCRYYYACNADLVAERLQCPDGAFFNPNILACVLGSC